MDWIRQRIVALGAGAVALLLLYAAAGFWLAPRVIRSQLVAWGQTNLDKTIGLGEIAFNPFTFTLDMDRVSVPGATQPMVAVDHLRLNFSILSLFTSAYRLDSLTIDRPRIDAVLRRDGSLNLVDLVPKSKSEGPAPSLRIGSFDVHDGEVRFTDLNLARGTPKILKPIAFTLRDFRTDSAEGGAFTLDGASTQGEKFSWKGTVAMAPVASRGRLTIADLHGETIQQYLPESVPVALTAGRISFTATYDAAYRDGGLKLNGAVPKLGLAGLGVAGDGKTVKGTLSLAYLGARIDRIAFASGAGPMQLSLHAPDVTIGDAAVSMPGVRTDDVLRLTALRVQNGDLDYDRRRLGVGRLLIAGAKLNATRESNGQINLTRLMPAATAAPSPQAAQAGQKPWQVRLGEMALSNAAVSFEDRAVSPAARFNLAPINMIARTGDAGASGPIALRFDASLDGKARIEGNGTVAPSTGVADLKIALAQLPIRSFVAYMPRYPGMDIHSGIIGLRGALHLEGANQKAMRFTGDGSVDDFRILETTSNSPLFIWHGCVLTGIHYTSAGVVIDSTRLSRPEGSVVVLPNGTFNYSVLMGTPPAQPIPASATQAAGQPGSGDAESKDQADAPTPPPPAKLPSAQEPALPVVLKRIAIVNGAMLFADHSIEPNFAARIDGLNGTMSNVSNRPNSVAAINLTGYVIDRFSPASIAGSMNLFSYDRQTDMKVAFRNIELPVFNPYSGRYAGYAIAKGKLTTDFAYRIENRALKADHHIRIDQLQWGQATDSKQKVPLPIRLATSLLKDKDGVIDLDVPVTGTLDDPKFSMGPIIWKIIGNIITKAITAPFRLIGSIFGGAEKAQYVDFAPGSAALPPGATESFAALSKALADRPALELDIPAGPGIREDADAIADKRIDTLMTTKEAKRGETVAFANFKIDEQFDRLRSLYKTKFGKAPEFPEDAAPPAAAVTPPTEADSKLKESDRVKVQRSTWMRSKLREQFMPSNAELATLGTARATAIRNALLGDAPTGPASTGTAPTGDTATIDPARLFMATQMLAAPTEGHSRVELKLK